MTSPAATLPPPPRPSGASAAWRDTVELLSSMRFAIALLTVICIASVIGTVIQQGQPANNYVNQFGPFWAEVFGALGLYTVYSAWWFLLILAFLVLSTSLCIARNLPKINQELRTFKEHVRETSLLAFPHKAEGVLDAPLEAERERVSRLLTEGGWRWRADVRPTGVMLAARKGAANKIGYLAAHGAIVLICIGGLLDGDLMTRIQMWTQGLTPFGGGPLTAEQAARHSLPEGNPAYRANLPVVEGQRSDMALITQPGGLLLQPLPFTVELKKFTVEFYPTGMPKLFASDIVIHDEGRAIPARVEVNKPVIHDGIAIYQSSFEDGGSRLTLKAHGWAGSSAALRGAIGSSQPLPPQLTGGQKLTLELAELRVFNVEDFSQGEAPQPGAAASGPVDARGVDFASRLDQHLGADKSGQRKNLRNVGPSVTYKLRDAAGQAREFHNYMAPMELDGQRVFLAGLRESQMDDMRYLRIPADRDDRPDDWLRMRAALADAAARDEAVRRYVVLATPAGRPELAAQLSLSAGQALKLFAGAEPAPRSPGQPDLPIPPGGLAALSNHIEARVPPEQREPATDIVLRILNGTLFELLNVSRERAGLAPLPPDDRTRAFMTQAVLSLSDAFFYPAPVWIELTGFEQVQASVFQVARAPGQKVVYLGCLLLTIGVFAMLYIRERRLWVWLAPGDDGRTRLRTALSATRQTLDTDREFDALKTLLLNDPAGTRA
jgi:cytochrome c biogenesis protein